MQATKADDLNHEPRPDPVWRESYFFNFYDPDRAIGMYTSMGERPFKNRAGSILTIWGSRGTFADNYIFDCVNRTDRVHRTQGLVYECIEPLEKWRLTYDGTLSAYTGNELRVNAADLTRQAAARRPQEKIELDLTWAAICPAHSYDPNPGMFDMHLEQHGQVSGWIKVAGEQIVVAGIGVRDRSCGLRNWGANNGWTWIPTFVQNPELPLLAAARVRHRDGKVEQIGYLYDKQRKRPELVVELQEEIEREGSERTGVPLRCKFEIKGQEGTLLTLRGKMLKVIPTVMLFKGGSAAGKEETCWIDRCLVEYDMGEGRVEFGEVELGNMLDYRPAF
jgi:hypothetical protein